ncbi:PoNe immunity protein domain-containing protein [Nitrogeniibacter aestuarii]|uniref:PoNe immunity protein domain-containing protein n=1 Tax=Nitrogeniibacter aestuarii TaxID=2815343 RepID=UPI001E481A4E|nr:PoNe immunity protein domain-containing protein [Nitrogeniibacter aestuarii]
MQFHKQRRQQFLGETYYRSTIPVVEESVEYFASNPYGSGSSELQREMLARRSSAEGKFDLLALRYTAGEPIALLRSELEAVISAYERYGEQLWKYASDRNDVVFKYYSLDDYCLLMQLIGLCFLLHRRDLLPRLAALQDGDNGANVGYDWLVEEFLSYAPLDRMETEHVCATRPYEPLIDAMSSETNEEAIKDLDRYLKHWYKDLSGTGWHDSHKAGAGYYGYWSFEAGAAVILLGIEDDSSLHKYLYYPKDLVAWSRENAVRFSDGGTGGGASRSRPNVPAGQPCPETGWWFTPAKQGSRRYFKQGETMPDVGGDYGAVFWQWSPDQSAPSL